VHERPDGVPLGMPHPERISGGGRRRLLAIALLAAALLATAVPAARADQVACGEVLHASTTISNGLVGCAGDGLVIGAGGITVDLGGHTVSGTGLGVGIRNGGHDGVTIRNGAVVNFDYGVVLSPGSAHNAVTGLDLANNEWSSIHLDGASGNHVAHNRVSDFSDVGVRLTNGSSGNVLGGNVIGAGGGDSFVVELGSDRNWLEGNAVQTSAAHAFRVEGSSNTMVLGNEIAGGSDVSVMMTGAPHSVVQANRIGTGGDAGVLISGASANVVRFNTLGQSGDAGVILDAVGNSLVKGNTMAQSGDAAIVLRAGSTDVRVIDNIASDSSDAGIFIADGVSNTVRGNILTHNAHGVELSGGRNNVVEFNATQANLGLGVEITGSLGNTIFGNTMDGNLQGGIWVDGGATGNTVARNAARGNDGDGLTVEGADSVVGGNLARLNNGWGIYAAPGVVDGGGNGASGNAEPAQCYLIVCSDGSDWQAPVRPPEPLDPLELGLPTQGAVPARSLRAGRAQGAGPGRRGRRGRVAMVVCKRRRAAKGRAPKGRAAKRRIKAVCKASYRAGRGSRRLKGRLIRHGKPVARGARRVRGGSRGTLSMLARKRPASGRRYRLVLTFRGERRRATVVRRTVRVRYLPD
jgi:parallel beta-helix repeat protein